MAATIHPNGGSMGRTQRPLNPQRNGRPADGFDQRLALAQRGLVIILKMSLTNSTPPVWRRFEVPARLPLRIVHELIMAAAGRGPDTAFEFDVGGYKAQGGHARLSDLAGLGIIQFSHLVGRDPVRQHRLEVVEFMSARNGVAYPRYVDGAGSYPSSGACNGKDPLHQVLLNGANPDPALLHEARDVAQPFAEEAEIRTRVADIAKRINDRYARHLRDMARYRAARAAREG